MKKILVITTGGTIAMKKDRETGGPVSYTHLVNIISYGVAVNIVLFDAAAGSAYNGNNGSYKEVL